MEQTAILIVEDNPLNLKLVKAVLELEGYQIWTATQAKEAFSVLEQLIPALILMDIQLPGVSGLDIIQQLRKDSRYRDIRIIAITAYAMKGDREKMLLAGCDGYISKPIDVVSFPDTIASFLSQKKCSGESLSPT